MRKLPRLLIIAILIMVCLMFFVNKTHADSSGTETGNSQNLAEGVSIPDQVGHNTIALNFVWVFLGGILVFFMQLGFAMVEIGFTQERNAAHVVMTNFVIFATGTIGFYLVGFALMFGGVGPLSTLGGQAILTSKFEVAKGWSLFGLKGFGLGGSGVYDVGIFLFFLFQVVFMDTAATIVTGSMAERWKWSVFLIYGFFMAMLLYPLYGHWVWGGGWLSQLGVNASLGHGFVDFAGSSVVHAVGGLCGLAGIYVMGPRIGRFDKDGKPRAIPGHNIPMAIFGTIILVFGWFGFNAGSTLSGGDLRLSVVAVNTLLAACAGCLSGMTYWWRKYGKPDPSMTANGMLAGLVAITAPCAFVSAWAAIVIGLIAGLVVCFGVSLLERWKLDDPVGAVAVHGFNGLFGVIALGIFADGTYGAGLNGVEDGVKGLIYGGGGQFVAQLIGAATCTVFVLGLSFLFWKLLDRVMGLRVAPQVEVEGLDIHEMGVSAYATQHVFRAEAPDMVLQDMLEGGGR